MLKVRRKISLSPQIAFSLICAYTMCISAEDPFQRDLFDMKTNPIGNGSISNSQVYHPVSTTNPLAQRHFDRGLLFIFSFNYDFANEEFEKAAELDPKLA